MSVLTAVGGCATVFDMHLTRFVVLLGKVLLVDHFLEVVFIFVFVIHKAEVLLRAFEGGYKGSLPRARSTHLTGHRPGIRVRASTIHDFSFHLLSDSNWINLLPASLGLLLCLSSSIWMLLLLKKLTVQLAETLSEKNICDRFAFLSHDLLDFVVRGFVRDAF